MALDDLEGAFGKPATWTQLRRRVGDVSLTLRRELTQAKLIALSGHEQAWFEPSTPLFGPKFEAGFLTEGALELDEAAKCLGLARPTAAVFHLMRVLEVGIRAMAAHLGIPDPVRPGDRNWSVILGKIMDDGIKVKWPNAAARMKPECLELEQLHASLDAVKNPFRNSTMHVESKFTDSEAQHIFALVKGFMMRLADRMDENGDPKV